MAVNSIQALAAIAARLNRAAGAPALPSLYFPTDPARTPDPCAVAARLPHGAAVIYRHFGAPERLDVARRLKRICAARGLWLLIGADPALARRVKAAGVHWPERLIPMRRSGFALETGAAHSSAALARAAAAGLDAALLSPVFESRSASAGAALGPLKAGAWARAARLPVMALGGVGPDTGRRLGRGFAGLAAVEALAREA